MSTPEELKNPREEVEAEPHLIHLWPNKDKGYTVLWFPFIPSMEQSAIMQEWEAQANARKV